MNRNTFYIIFAALTFGLLINSFFVVNEKERAIVFQFGEAVRPDIPVGFHFKLPIIQDVKKYDARIQTLDEEPDRILTVESKYLLVDSFIKYRITDVLTFYKANNGSFNSLNSLLGQRSEFVLKNNFGKRTVKEVVSGERDELMSIMLSSLNESVKDLGVEIIDFRVKRIDLPSISRILSPGSIPPTSAGLAFETEPMTGFKGGKIPNSYKRFEGSSVLSQLLIGK